jgi:hypothetical protein
MMSEILPAIPLSDDLIDRIAKEIAAQIADHMEIQYPAATEAVAWKSCKRSLQGVVRNAIASAGRAAENGSAEGWIERNQRQRRELRRIIAATKSL